MFCGIYFKFNFKLKLHITLNVGKQEISFPLSTSEKSKNYLRKIILTFQHYQTLSQRIFLSGYRGSKCQARKNGLCPMFPLETCYDFFATTKTNTHKSHKWFAGYCFRLEIRMIDTPIRCNYLPLCL